MSTKELQEKVTDVMNRWQVIEDASVKSTSKVIEQTKNPVIKMVMEIIKRDSQMHHQIQQMIIDTLEKEAVAINPDELSDVWDLIEKHINLEKKTIELATEAKKALKGTQMVVQEYLLDYLTIDEEKHEKILASLSTIKRGMYPYG